MAKFFYKVKNSDNKIEQGSIEAVSFTEVASKLERKGFIVLEVKEAENTTYNLTTQIHTLPFPKNTVFKIEEKKEFFSSFYFLYKSGYSVMQIFESMYGSSKNPRIKALSSKILKGIMQGYSLRDSMTKYSNALGLAYTMLVVAGEESGKLDDILSSVIQNITMQEKVKNDIISKMTYPVSMFFFAIIVGLFFKFFVIRIFQLSAQGESINIGCIAISAFIKIASILICIALVAYIIFKSKYLLGKIISKLLAFGPVGNLMKNYAFSNFFSVLALAYGAGLTGSESLSLAKSVVDLPNVGNKLKKASNRVLKGCELTTALIATNLFTDFAISQISAGEKAGELEKMLKAVAYDYESRLQLSLNVILKLLGPIMIAIVGVVVFYVALSGYRAYYGYLFSLM